MKFVTREKPKVDRIACPWLIKRFLDPNAELLFVPADQIMRVAEAEGALPYDVSGVELGHHNGGSSFEAFIAKYKLTDPALLELAKIVHSADTQDGEAAPEGEGLRQIANGWHLLDWPLEKRLEVGFGVYDCLYAVCQQRVSHRTVLFLCPHNAAKSVIAAAYFNKRALAEGLAWRADSAGTEPSETVSPVVVAMLSRDDLDVSHFKPRTVTPAELRDSGLVVSIGCTPQELSGVTREIEYWDDVPPVSQTPEGSREAIYQHVNEIIHSLGDARF
jgi:protein-tyrosine-phosphatase